MIGAGLLAPQRGRARADAQPVGQVVARAGLEGRHRVLPPLRPRPLPRRARLQHRRLRLHDLHRQLRPAAGGDRRGDRGGRARRLRRALRQPQLRGAHPRRGQGELPRLAAARRRLRARRPDGRRPDRRAARAGPATANDVYLRDIWPSARGDRPRDRRVGPRRDVRRAPTRTSSPATSAGAPCETPEGDLYDWDPDSTYVRLPPYFEGMPREPGTVGDIEGARCLVLLGDSVTTDHISPAGSIRPDSPAGQYLIGARRRAARVQLVRVAARQPRGDDARHVRERPPAQPARPRQRGHLDGAPARTARRARSSTSRCATAPRACRRSCSRARSTARARRATGRRRGRTCSACAR